MRNEANIRHDEEVERMTRTVVKWAKVQPCVTWTDYLALGDCGKCGPCIARRIGSDE